MGYQVLARKWRPNRFGELVGQEHVVTAISNALDNDRLHHAYLFTGTRGVGKTTIARIFSKSLNCEQGLSAKPCGQCSTCKEIENGNYIDLLEIDAASRTKVEDTRELLDNVQYKPSRGRYKVYLIDEVHMLSKHSFNALLKTLEEPPPHVKFLLATTDPQKLPVTILSRCLQFNLKALSRSQISQQLAFVLGEEGINCEPEALTQLARAAQGSMRDALSLTDQAIAQGNGQVSLQIVTDMLGLMDKNQVLKLVYAVVQKDSQKVMQQVQQMSEQAPDYGLVLSEIMSLLHQVALTQFVPDACKLETISARAIFQLANTVPAEQIQLLYQIALTGKKDLPHAADARTGLEMTLLRMLAFCPNNLKLEALDIATKSTEAEIPSPSVPSQSNHATTGHATAAQTKVVEVDELSQNDDAASSPVVAQLDQQTSTAVEPAAQKTEPSLQQDSGEHSAEHSAEHSPDVEPADSAAKITQTNSSEEALFAQQQEIMAQAESFGHQAIDYDQYQAVSMEERPNESFAADYDEPVNLADDLEQAKPNLAQSTQPEVVKPNTSTAELIALRNKLKQTQSDGGEGAETVKKSESASSFDLAAIRKQNNQNELKQTPAADISNTQAQPNPTALHHQPQAELVSEASQTATPPPWAVDNQSHAKPSAIGVNPMTAESKLEEADVFDSSAHLDQENVGEVTLEIKAFLAVNQKVTQALQVDDWSRLIEDMQVTALTKQLALHSAFIQDDKQIKLTLLESKAHLISDTAQQQLQQALCLALNKAVELEIELGQPINTPYALQLKVNQVRHEYARDVVKNDPGIQLLKQQFAAKVDEQSIQAR